MIFTAEELGFAAKRNGMHFPEHVLDQLVAAIDSGKHVVLTGPPGTGKTTLAYLTAEVAQKSMLCTGYLPTTATTEWTTFETIGGFQPTAEGLIFRPGMFVEAIESGRWLVIDELNRSNFDRAFGQLFTVLSGQAVVLPFKRGGRVQPISLVPPGVDAPDDTDADPAAGHVADPRHDERVRQEPALRDVVRAHAAVRVRRGHLPVRRGLPRAARGSRATSSASSCRCGGSATSARPCTSTPPSSRSAGPRTSRRGAACSTRSSTPTSCRSSRASTTSRPSRCTSSMAELLDEHRARRGPPHHRRGPRHRAPGLSSHVRRRARAAASPSCSSGWRAPTTRSGSPPRCSACRRGWHASSSAPCSPPATRPRTCSTPCPRSCARWRSPPPTEPERCVGEIRGPVLWGETMSARSSSAGDPGLFVCATTTKAYDTDENRVLKAALAAVHRAGRHAEHGMEGYTDEVVKRARHNGQHAGRLLEHQTLAQVPVVRPTGRALRRTRAGQPAPHLPPRPRPARAGRASRCRPPHLSAFADERTARPARPARGHPPAPRGRHRHQPGAPQRPRRAGRRAAHATTTPAAAATPGHLDGITIGDVLLDVPDPLDGDPARPGPRLEARAGDAARGAGRGRGRRRGSRGARRSR